MIHVQLFYEVVYGDTITDIARRFGMDVPKLVGLNGDFYSARDVNEIQVGELIRIQ